MKAQRRTTHRPGTQDLRAWAVNKDANEVGICVDDVATWMRPDLDIVHDLTVTRYGQELATPYEVRFMEDGPRSILAFHSTKSGRELASISGEALVRFIQRAVSRLNAPAPTPRPRAAVVCIADARRQTCN